MHANQILLKNNLGLQSHLLRGTYFSQYHPHQLDWGDQEMGTAISCTKHGQVTDIICGN